MIVSLADDLRVEGSMHFDSYPLKAPKICAQRNDKIALARKLKSRRLLPNERWCCDRSVAEGRAILPAVLTAGKRRIRTFSLLPQARGPSDPDFGLLG